MIDFIKEILEDKTTFGGFEITKYKQSQFDKKEDNIHYGVAKDKHGMTIIHWDTKGHFCNYYGHKLEPNISVSISKDGGTRTVFSGYVYTKEDFLKVLTLTW